MVLMDEDSPNSEDLIEEIEDGEDDGEELFEIENEHERDCQHGFGIESNDHGTESEQFFTIDTSGHVESEHMLELEGESHGSEHLLELKGNSTESNALQTLNISSIDRENNQGNNISIVNNEDCFSQEKYYPPPVVGMEFESYDDAYNYYNCYAKELGFAIRVKSSWTKRNSKEKRGAVLCCNCEGFKTFKEATNRRKETRTGCLAMIRLRLVESNRWRVDEVKLEHNHFFDPERVQNSKSHKKMEVGTKRKSETALDVEVQTIKLYLTRADSGTFQSALNRTVYGSLKLDEFETSWETMIQQFGIRDREWLQLWYDDREKWAPAYLKDTFLAGLFSLQRGEPLIPFFQVHEQTSVREFFDMYDMILQKKHRREARQDTECRESNPSLRTRCHYELQLSKFYTIEIFEKFQAEVEMMPCCFSISQVHATGPVITYIVKECETGGIKEFKNFEVVYDKASMEIRCTCGGFYLSGYLCRHALSVFNHNGVEEIPSSYILPRWRKDCKRLYVPALGSNTIDLSNPTQWHEHLHKQAIQVVEKGMSSQDHYRVAWQAFLESLNKVRLTVEKHV
ncbi:hypothetical protein Cgig2_012419 [Carnegiea gigantea]|uniref:Protein FAR1-RELATED SEQUENCE n=1 Tax=Carnegiea gigantea TaxID=171969 RepID=A0A9Q1QL26_9CARY|nr:hypothetical protein Cgig2_012419 [Carnegiea gigantea]